MTEPRDNSVPQAVDRVMTELHRDNTAGALKQIQEETNKPGARTETNKEFLTQLTQKAQEEGYLPKLAVDFGQKNFKTLDLDGNGKISGGELQHILNDQKMMKSLDPFQREMASYLLANSKEIGTSGINSNGVDQGITSSKLDSYAKQADTKYEAFQNGQKLAKQLGTKESFDAIDTNKDGFLTTAEIDKGINFANRVLSMPKLIDPEQAKNLKEQKEALEYLKSHRSEVGAAADDSFWHDASMKDIQAHAAKNANPRTSENVPKIDDKIADASSQQKGKVDMSRGEHMSEVMIKYLADHQRELDLDGSGKISKAELNKILDTPQWKNTLSKDEIRVIEAMRDRFNDVSKGGEISLSSMAEYVRKEEKARSEETKSAATAKYAREGFTAADTDGNGWLSEQEITDAKDFFSKMSANKLVKDEAKGEVEANLKALQYLEENKRDISSAITNNDMKLSDIEKFASSKAGHHADIFKPTKVEETKEAEKKLPTDAVAKPAEAVPVRTKQDESAARPNAIDAKPADTETKPEEAKAKPQDDAKTKPQDIKARPLLDLPNLGKPSATEEPECVNGVCKIPASKYPHLDAGKPQGNTADKLASNGQKVEGPKPGEPIDAPKPEGPTDTPKPESPKLEAPKTKPKLEKPLIDPSELTKEPEQEERVRTQADLPQEPKEEKIEEGEKEKPLASQFKYTKENYGDALKTAAEQNKPVVLVIATGKDREAIQAAADASKDGKSIVVYIDKDSLDAKSPLGAYAASVLENHNRKYGTKDESMTTVFHVNKDANGRLQTESPKFANYGSPGDIAPLLTKQIDAVIAQRAAAQAKRTETRPIEQRPVTEVSRPVQSTTTYAPANACNNSVIYYQNYYSNGRRVR